MSQSLGEMIEQTSVALSQELDLYCIEMREKSDNGEFGQEIDRLGIISSYFIQKLAWLQVGYVEMSKIIEELKAKS